jgi:dTDP-4-amino-4,6-dideoxygalactose transaminase
MAVAVKVPITRPELGDEELAAVARVIRSGWIMMGPEVAAFEAELAAAVGAAHAVAVASGTAALELALRALGVGPGDEVITVSHSFIATANVVVNAGATPVFVDVEEDTLGMDPRHLEAAITARTRAILPAHQLGAPCDLAGILAAARGIPVVEDAACALGSELDGARLGRPHGVVATFSFHPRKVVTCGDGGAITTADAALAERLRLLRNHAISPAGHLMVATNARLTDLQAAVLRPQLARLARSVAERRRIAARYDAALAAHPRLAPRRERPGARGNVQSYAARARAGADAAALVRALAERGIDARPGVSNAHQEPAYAQGGRARIGPGGLAVSERVRRETVILPLFHGMRPDEEDAVLAACAGV